MTSSPHRSISRAAFRLPLLSALALAGCTDMPSFGAKTAPATPLAADTTATSGPAIRTPVPAPASARLSGNISSTSFGSEVRAAMLASPVTLSNAATVRSARALVDAERGAYMPQVVFETDVTTSGTTPELALTQLVYDGGATKARVKAATVQAYQNREDQVAALASETLRAVEAAITLERARRFASVARSNEAQLSRLRSIVRDRVDAGAGSTADLLAAESRLTRAQSDTLEADAALKQAIGNYTEVFGKPPASTPDVPDAPALKSTDIQTIIAASPRMTSLRLAREKVDHEIAALTADGFPRLSVRAASGLGQRPGNQRDLQAGLNVTVPIATGGQRKARIASAQERAVALEADQERLRRALVRGLSEAQNEISSRRTRLANARRAVNTADQALASAQDQFSIGRATVTTLLDSQRDVAEAQRNLAEIEAATKLDGYALLGLTGDILDAFGIPNPRTSIILPDVAR
ncbi:TolC family protein [Pseudooceanicola sp. MF1-13]|uniref:TolC family protein n=1 Tax=Pseudooceanicola sp. MF1-13 TaxID=3379095 RepID=UPI0038915D18